MRKRLKQAAIVFVLVFVAAQLIRPARGNPPIDSNKTIQASLGATHPLARILNRSCADCHSNTTTWPWITNVAPVSWLMAATVSKGRTAMNLSEWATYDSATRREILVSSCDAVRKNLMPGGLWTTLHPETRLSAQDIAAICAAARQLELR